MNSITPPIKAPPVVLWYKVYCSAMALMYVAVAIAGLFLLVADVSTLAADAAGVTGLRIQGAIFLTVGVPFAILYVVATLLPPKPWTWVVGMVAIAIALTSCCCLPVAVPLFIYWMKPENKAYFGRT